MTPQSFNHLRPLAAEGLKRDVLVEAVDNPGREVLALRLDDRAQHGRDFPRRFSESC
jgi:hypothetical protein